MTYSQEWDTAYQKGQLQPQYMERHLAFLLTACVRSLIGKKVLELGCSSGMNAGNILLSEAEYWGIDGSESAIREAVERYPQGRFLHGDFTTGGFHDFDVVFDRASVCHNDSE